MGDSASGHAARDAKHDAALDPTVVVSLTEDKSMDALMGDLDCDLTDTG